MMSCNTRGWRNVQRVAGSGVVHVVARIVGHEPIVRGIIDSRSEASDQVIAFGGMVIHDIENDFESFADEGSSPWS